MIKANSYLINIINKNKINLANNFLFLLLPFSLILGNAALNINIVLIDILFLLINKKNILDILKSKVFKSLIILWTLVIVGDVINQNQFLFKSLGLIRFIIFILATIDFFNKEKNISDIFFYIYLFIFIFLFFDLNYQFYNKENIFGMSSGSTMRNSSIFGDEWIAGSYLFKNFFLFIPLIFYKKKGKYFFIILLFLILEAIIVTGDRTPIFQFIFMILLFPFLISKNLKQFFLSLAVYFFLLIFIVFSIYQYAEKSKYNNFIKRFKFSAFERYINFEPGTQTRLMKYGAIIFSDNLIFGIGTNNFYKKCLDYEKKDNYFLKCENHPHNHLIEMAVEQGIIFLLIFFFLLFRFLNSIYNNQKSLNIIGKFRLISFLVFFTPFFFTGSVFSTWTMFFITFNFSLLFSNENYRN